MGDIVRFDRGATDEEKALLDDLSLVAVVAFLTGQTWESSVQFAFGRARAQGRIKGRGHERRMKLVFGHGWRSLPYISSALEAGLNVYRTTAEGSRVSFTQAVERLKGIEAELAERGCSY